MIGNTYLEVLDDFNLIQKKISFIVQIIELYCCLKVKIRTCTLSKFLVLFQRNMKRINNKKKDNEIKTT
jgi:hypothetical protein